MENQKTCRVIDVTPTWESMVPVFVMLIENGNSKARKTAIEEMTRMAQMLDAFIAEHKTA